MKVWSTDQSKILEEVITSDVCSWLSTVHSSLDAGQILSCVEIHQYGCWLDKRALRTRVLSAAAFLILTVYMKAQFHFQQQESLLFCLCPGFSCFIHIFIYFPRDTAQSVKEKFGKKLYNALLKWVYRLLRSALQSHIFSWLTCGISVLLLFV